MRLGTWFLYVCIGSIVSNKQTFCHTKYIHVQGPACWGMFMQHISGSHKLVLAHNTLYRHTLWFPEERGLCFTLFACYCRDCSSSQYSLSWLVCGLLWTCLVLKCHSSPKPLATRAIPFPALHDLSVTGSWVNDILNQKSHFVFPVDSFLYQ